MTKEIRPKTIEEHRDYLYQIVRLKLFFLHDWLKKHPEETFRHVIRNRIDIYRKTNANKGLLNPTELLFDQPEWKEMEDKAENLYNELKNYEPSFESAAFEVFRPSIDERLEKDFSDRTGLATYQCGSLKHEEKLTADGESIGFHIANAVAPRSIFDDPLYLPQCFLKLINAVETQYGAKKITCGSWLNSNPAWLAVMPQEWSDNLEPEITDVQWHYGFWGQFISARGTFNAKPGAKLRETGRLPYYLRCSKCTCAAMRKHLADKFGVK